MIKTKQHTVPMIPVEDSKNNPQLFHNTLDFKPKRKLPLNMKIRFLYGLIMFIVFITLYAKINPFIATYALMGMGSAEMAVILARKEPVKAIDWVQFLFLVAFGAAAILLHNPILIQLKFPLLSLCFAGGMIGYSLYAGKSFMKLLMSDFNLPEMPDKTWQYIDAMIIGNLIVKATINITLIFLFPQIWYHSNFILPAFDVTMLIGVVLVSREYFKDPSIIQHPRSLAQDQAMIALKLDPPRPQKMTKKQKALAEHAKRTPICVPIYTLDHAVALLGLSFSPLFDMKRQQAAGKKEDGEDKEAELMVKAESLVAGLM